MLAYMNDGGSPLNAYPAFCGPFSIIGEGAARATVLFVKRFATADCP
jgi:hypothetical protein